MTEKTPLRGRAIVVTRPEHQAGDLLRTLHEMGAETVAFPTIQIQPRPDTSALDRALNEIDSYQWLIFTSANGVRIALDRYSELQLDWEKLRPLRLAAIGPATSRALGAYGLRAEFVPDSFIAEEVAAGIPDAERASILLPRAAGARPVLPRSLRSRGATVDEIPIYEAVRAELDPLPLDRLHQGVDAITFTSPSTAASFVELTTMADLDPMHLPGSPLIACIGPITEAAARALGYQPKVVARVYTSEGLVDALVTYYTEEVHDGDG